MPLLFSGLVLVQPRRSCRVSAAAMVIPALVSGQFWPSPARGPCSSGVTPGRGGKAGTMLFGAISIVSAMVVSVVVRVIGQFSCRVYVKSGTIL